MAKRFLVTGCAGFIGYHLCRHLLAQGAQVAGIDDLGPGYPLCHKRLRLDRLASPAAFEFIEGDLSSWEFLKPLLKPQGYDAVFHLAARTGVRQSAEYPREYVSSNLVGFFNVLECCRAARCPHLIYASSSSVYGDGPFGPHSPADSPLSLYAATKRADELMASAYGHLYSLPSTGLRFFTVYGPYGRPDMAPFLFANAIMKQAPLTLYGGGLSSRDFTFVDDAVAALNALLTRSAALRPPYRQVYDVGRGRSVTVKELLRLIEMKLGVKALLRHAPLPPGDAKATRAHTQRLLRDGGLRPATSLSDGLDSFLEWFLTHRHSLE